MSTKTHTEHKSEAEVVVPELVYFTKTVHHDTYSRISPSRLEASVRDKNIVVTGGGTGIGKAIAIAFAQAGAKSVSILGRREAHLKTAVEELQGAAKSHDSMLLYETCDLTKRDQVQKGLESLAKKVGKIDILVSNAGVLPDLNPIASYNVDQFMYGFNLNVLSALNVVQEFLLRCGPEPVIINISTCIAHMSPMPNVSGYAVSKAANLKLMDYFAAENPHLHVVNVQPGTVATDMAEKAGVPGKDKVELPAHFCVWLASKEAEFLRSKFVWANWDVDELIARREEIKSSRLLTWLLDGVPL